MQIPEFDGLHIEVNDVDGIGILELARPEKLNAFSSSMWADFAQAMRWLDECNDIHAVIIMGQGKGFCAGIDLQSLGNIAALMKLKDRARSNAQLRRTILQMQESFNAIEQCRWPVIAAIHGLCIGGGLDLIAACDMRICSSAASFCLKEVDLAIAADLGSLHRLPKLIGYGTTMELALTARQVSAAEAQQMGLVTHVCPTKAELVDHAMDLAGKIAKKSLMAVTGIKQVMLHAREHSVKDGLEYIATWNGGQMLSRDLAEVFAATQEKRAPLFSKL